MVQNVQYLNGPPSQVTLPFEYQTPILSGIKMVTVFYIDPKERLSSPLQFQLDNYLFQRRRLCSVVKCQLFFWGGGGGVYFFSFNKYSQKKLFSCNQFYIKLATFCRVFKIILGKNLQSDFLSL